MLEERTGACSTLRGNIPVGYLILADDQEHGVASGELVAHFVRHAIILDLLAKVSVLTAPSCSGIQFG